MIVATQVRGEATGRVRMLSSVVFMMIQMEFQTHATARWTLQKCTGNPGRVGTRPIRGISCIFGGIQLFCFNNNNNKRPLTPKSMPLAGDEYAKLKT